MEIANQQMSSQCNRTRTSIVADPEKGIIRPRPIFEKIQFCRWMRCLLFAGLFLSLCLPYSVAASYRFPQAITIDNSQWLYFPWPDLDVNEPPPQPTLPDDEALIAQGETDLFHPSAAAGGMVVWYASGAEGMDVFGLHLNDDGTTPGEPFLIAGGPGDQVLPFVAKNTEDGEYLVVWHDLSDGDNDVYARYLDEDGRPQGNAFIVCATGGDQLRPIAAYVAAADAFLVVWQDGRLGGEPDLYARLVPSFSTSLWGNGDELLGIEFVVSASTGGQFIPTAACEIARSQCLIVWQDNRNAPVLFTDVVGRLVDAADGAALGEEIEIAVASDYQYSPVVVFNPASDEYLVVWDDDISARRVSRAGQPLGSKIPVSLESPHQYRPAVGVAEDGSYLVVWEDLRNLDSRGADIYGQWLSPSGRPLGTNFALSKNRYNQYSPTLIAGQGWGPGEFFVIWEDDRASGATLSLYGGWLSRSAEGE